MLLDQLNLNYLRIFEAVYRTRSMTQAATEMHLTQSGISQHVKSLEETLEVKLFDRIKQKLVPTSEGQKLYEQLAPNLKTIEKILTDITNKDNILRGKINIGMPVVFGLNLILPILTDFGKKYPQLKFNIKFDLAPKFNEQLLNGEIDFAFVDEFRLDEQISTKNVYDETLLLCCSEEYFKQKPFSETKKYFESLDYICYEKSSQIAQKWFKHNYKYGSMSLKVSATIADALGVAKFISSGLGVGVLPKHQVERIIDNGRKIHVFSNKNTKALTNRISLASVKGRSWPNSVKETYEFISQQLEQVNS